MKYWGKRLGPATIVLHGIDLSLGLGNVGLLIWLSHWPLQFGHTVSGPWGAAPSQKPGDQLHHRFWLGFVAVEWYTKVKGR